MPRGAGAVVKHLARELSGSGSGSRSTSPPKSRRSRSFSGSGASAEDDPRGPRLFPTEVKKECWGQAQEVPGRDPERWRQDAVGNVVFRKLNSCEGCLCHDYDHIVPYSKGGTSTLDNCQLLQTRANRAKGDRESITRTELQQRSVVCVLSRRDMDAVELGAYGNVQRTARSERGCSLQ